MANKQKTANLWEATVKYVKALREFPQQEVNDILFVLRRSHELLLPGQKVPSSARTPDDYVEAISEQLGSKEQIAVPLSASETQGLSEAEEEDDMEDGMEDGMEDEQRNHVDQYPGGMNINITDPGPALPYLDLESLSMPQESSHNPNPDDELPDINIDDILNDGYSGFPPTISDGTHEPPSDAEQWVNYLPETHDIMFAQTVPSEEDFRDSPLFFPSTSTPPEEELALDFSGHQENTVSSAGCEIDQTLATAPVINSIPKHPGSVSPANSTTSGGTAIQGEITIEALMETVEEYPQDMKFELDWDTVHCQDVIQWLRWLQPGSWVGGALINYFVRKWSTVNKVAIMESDWCSSSSSSLKGVELSTPKVFVPCFRSEHWTLVTVDIERRMISHDDSLYNSQHLDGKTCRDCEKIRDAVSDLFRNQERFPPTWSFEATMPEQQTNTNDCGIFLLWFLFHRAREEPIRKRLPEEYRLQLAWEIVDDLRKYKQKYDLQSIIGASMNIGKQKRKSELMAEEDNIVEGSGINWEKESLAYSHTLVTELERVAKITIKGLPLGLERANRILQLAINIASPEVYLQLKHNITSLRKSRSNIPQISKNIKGIIRWGIFHNNKARSSNISLRLVSWFIYDHVSQLRLSRNAAIESLARSLDGEEEEETGLDQHNLENLLKNWERRGREWDNVIKSTCDDINVMLYLPDDLNIFQSEKPINITEYRDLRINEAKAMGDIFKAVRPNLTLPGGQLLYKVFLWNELPPESFKIELWEDKYIRRLAYNSRALQQAFDLTTIDRYQ